jgi:uncharacterized protein YecE (DUF72 family)
MIKVGTCGFGYFNPGNNWKQKYKSKLEAFADWFSTIEINSTFYKLPQHKTAERWRSEVPSDFDFCVKVWQAVTHPTSSSTWRKRKEKLSPEQLDNFGMLRPHQQVIEAWEQTRERAQALQASVCLLQAPASFDCTEENEKNMRELLSTIDRGNMRLAWEPRGNWNEHLDRVEALCSDLDLIHVVDIMRRDPVDEGEVAYVRLHGLNKREFDFNYEYSEDELQSLAEKLRKLDEDRELVYCMFNNREMFDNAGRLLDIL